jgi:hypothetical protein
MATVSFDRKMVVKKENIDHFISLLERPMNRCVKAKGLASPKNLERSEALLKQYFLR